MAKLRLSALLLIAGFLPLTAYAQKSSFSQVDLFHQGQDGVNTYRIPALIQTRQGTLIAVADARLDSSHDLPGRIRLEMRRSIDEGRTWGPARTIIAVKAGGVGDASLLLDRSTGRVWCFFNYGPPGVGFPTAKPGERAGTHYKSTPSIATTRELRGLRRPTLIPRLRFLPGRPCSRPPARTFN